MSRKQARARNVIFSDAISKEMIDIVTSTGLAKKPQSELEMPLWAVISFQGVEASRLLYREARGVLGELQQKGIAGLCVVTNDVAERIWETESATKKAA